MQTSGWGKHPVIDSEFITPSTVSDLSAKLCAEPFSSGIARGMGRSYGDSALAAHTISMLSLNHILDFDEAEGVVCCSAGVTLSKLLEIFVPRGWFLPVTPGTKFVTVGGAIASDIHGKNHHINGCFSEYLKSLRLMLGNGEVIYCSKDENPELFRATCGGMGLTGIICDATFSLMPISSSFIEKTTFVIRNLKDLFMLLEEHSDARYSVAWIDSLSSGNRLGRSVLMLGEHVENGNLTVSKNKSLTVPFD